MENSKNNKYQESVIDIEENDLINNDNNLNEASKTKEQNSSLISTEFSQEKNNLINNSENSIDKPNKTYNKKSSMIEFKEKEANCKPAKDKEDFFYKKKFLSEEWFKRSKYIDIDLVQDHLSSFKYLWTECQDLEIICTEKLFNHAMTKPNLFESKNVRNIVRNGIPPKYMNTFLLKLFNITKNTETLMNNYNKILSISLKGYKAEYLDDYVPYFSGLKKLGDCLPVHYLNNSGILALKEILWMLYHLYPQIEYCPLIIQLLSLILVFCNKYETLEIMSCIIGYNLNYDKNEIYKIRWHFRLNYNDNLKIITSITECLKEVSYKSCKELYDHLTNIHFRPEKLYEDMCFGFFYKYFNFFGMIRLLPFYLHDGIKSIYRLIYAIEKCTKDELKLIKVPDKIIGKCRELCNSLDNIKDLFEISYEFNITRNNNKYSEQSNIKENDKHIITYKGQLILPEFKEKSEILNEYQIIHLWENMPKSFKANNVSVTQFQPNKSKISDIIDKFNKEEKKYIFLIKTTTNEIFGFAINGNFKDTNGKYINIKQGILISIEPIIKIYNINAEYNEILFIDKDKILFGKDNTDTITIKISEDLSNGETHETDFFNNHCLVNKEDGNFKIELIEIFELF
jgi:hypothetical protein